MVATFFLYLPRNLQICNTLKSLSLYTKDCIMKGLVISDFLKLYFVILKTNIIPLVRYYLFKSKPITTQIRTL